MNFIFFPIYRILWLSLMLMCCSLALAKQPPAGTLVGFWKATTYYDEGASSEDREISRLQIKVSNEAVTGLSTTGAVWKGFYDETEGLLTMRYRRGDAHGEILLRLSEDGETLKGEWFNHSGESGRYIAIKE